MGLPDPNSKKNKDNQETEKSKLSNSSIEDRIIHLSDARFSKWTEEQTRKAKNKVIYLKPDNLHRIDLIGMDKELLNGNLIIVNLKSLIHMPSQTAKCSRELQNLAENNGLNVFALNETDTLLMIPGVNMRVDTHKHILGISGIN